MLAARYLAALRTHLGRKPRSEAARAQTLGRAAFAAGLVTLDLAIMHEQAVLALAPCHDFARPGNGSLQQAGRFFQQALRPLEAASRHTRETNRHLQETNETLRVHTAALARSNRQLEREVRRRETGEAVIRRGKARYQTLYLDSQVMQRKLRHLTHQILLAQEEERKMISRELHDEVVQTLVGINVELSSLHHGVSVGLHELKAKITRTQRLVAHSVSAVHRFARELRPAVLDDLGLIPALHAYCKSLALRNGIKIQLTAFGGVELLTNARRVVLFRVAQEALTNVVRHAHATEVVLAITRLPAAIRMDISDNGQAFSVKKTLLAKNNKRLGLVGMKERIEMIGGQLTIESAIGTGTTVRTQIPFPLEKPKK